MDFEIIKAAARQALELNKNERRSAAAGAALTAGSLAHGLNKLRKGQRPGALSHLAGDAGLALGAGSLLSAKLREHRKAAAMQTPVTADANQAPRPRVKGMKVPRWASPRVQPGTTGRQKGTVPVNPFSGNWYKPAPTVMEAASGATKAAALTTSNTRRLYGAAVGGLAGAVVGGKKKGKKGALAGGLGGAAFGGLVGEGFDRLRPVATSPLHSVSQALNNKSPMNLVWGNAPATGGQRQRVTGFTAHVSGRGKPAHSTSRMVDGRPVKVEVVRHGDDVAATIRTGVRDSEGRISPVLVARTQGRHSKKDLESFVDEAIVHATRHHPRHVSKKASGLAEMAKKTASRHRKVVTDRWVDLDGPRAMHFDHNSEIPSGLLDRLRGRGVAAAKKVEQAVPPPPSLPPRWNEAWEKSRRSLGPGVSIRDPWTDSFKKTHPDLSDVVWGHARAADAQRSARYNARGNRLYAQALQNKTRAGVGAGVAGALLLAGGAAIHSRRKKARAKTAGLASLAKKHVTPKRALIGAALGATALKSHEAIKNRRTDAKQLPGYATTTTARGLMSGAEAAQAARLVAGS